MAREKECYRENLEILNTRFPDHDLLSVEEVLQVTGYTDRRTLMKYIGPKNWINRRLSKAYLARYMCG
jgi:hypothetical protein